MDEQIKVGDWVCLKKDTYGGSFISPEKAYKVLTTYGEMCGGPYITLATLADSGRSPTVHNPGIFEKCKVSTISCGDLFKYKGGCSNPRLTPNNIYKIVAFNEKTSNIEIFDDHGRYDAYKVAYFERLSGNKKVTFSNGEFVICISTPAFLNNLIKGEYYKVLLHGSDQIRVIGDDGIYASYPSKHFEKLTTPPCPRAFSSLDFSKQIMTRSGKKVEILTIKGKGEFPVIYLIEGSDLEYCTKLTGRNLHDITNRSGDLINVPETIKVNPFYIYVSDNGVPVLTTKIGSGATQYSTCVKVDLGEIKKGRFDE